MKLKALRGSARNDLLARYRKRIDTAKRHRDKDGYDALWKRLVDLYRGKHFETNLLSNEDRIAINIAFATVNTILPNISINHPKLVVWAQDNQDDARATIIETVLNYWWRHFKVQSQASLAVKDYLIIGHGWVKVGWRYVEEARELAKQEQEEAKVGDQTDEPSGDSTGEMEGSPGSTPADATPAKEQAPNGDTLPQDENEPAADDVSTNIMDVVEDRPFVERVSPFDILVDPEATCLDDLKWIAQRIVKPLEEVRQDTRYRAAARRCLKPDAQINPDWRQNSDRIDDDVKRVTIYEFYDIVAGTMCVFSELGDEILLDPIPQPYTFGHPFVMLRNYEVPDFFYPMGDLEALEPLQLELDKTRSQLMNHRKRYNRKWLYNPHAFDQTGTGLLQTDQDNVMVPVVGNVPLAEAVVPLKQEAINPELYNYIEGIEQDIDRVSAVGEFEGGADSKVRKSATEASAIQDASNARAASKMSDVENFIARVADRVMQLAQQYLTEDQVARIVGKNGQPIWVPYTREDIQGEFDYEVEAGSMAPMNETARRQQAVQLLQAFSPYVQLGVMNLQELIKYALQFGYGIKNPDKFMVQGAPPGGPPQEGQGAQHTGSPSEKIIESINYKDLPADIQRQLEQMAGFQPSQIGGSSPVEAHMAKLASQAQQARDKVGETQAKGQQAHQTQSNLLGHQAALQAQGNHHEVAMQVLQAQHQHQMATLQAQHEAQIAAAQAQQQHQMGMQQAEQQHGQALEQQVVGAAMQPPGGASAPR